jgi:hypothetical protein
MWQVIGSPTLAPSSPWYRPKLTSGNHKPFSNLGFKASCGSGSVGSTL